MRNWFYRTSFVCATFLSSHCLAGPVTSFVSPFAAPVTVFTESMVPVTGTFSVLGSAPTPIPAFQVGNNDVSGQVEGGQPPPTFVNTPIDIDHFLIVIPEGAMLTGIRLEDYEGDDFGFIGMNNDVTFPVDFLTESSDTTQFIGGSIFGTANQFELPFPDNPPFPRQNFLEAPDGVFGLGGPTGSKIGPFSTLPSGAYSVIVQQTGATTNYRFRFTVEAIPEPTSALLTLSAFAALVGLRRRQA